MTETEPVSLFPAGYSDADQQSSGSRLRNAVSRAGSLLWMVATSPGGLQAVPSYFHSWW